jgi:hypothetical protein
MLEERDGVEGKKIRASREDQSFDVKSLSWA